MNLDLRAESPKKWERERERGGKKKGKKEKKSIKSSRLGNSIEYGKTNGLPKDHGRCEIFLA